MCISAVSIPAHLLYLAIKPIGIVSGGERKPEEDTIFKSCAVAPIHSITPWNIHAINRVIATLTVSSQTHPSQGNWICGGLHSGFSTDQPTRTEWSISSTLTLTRLWSSNMIHNQLSSNSSWTCSNPFSLFSLFFFPATPWSHTKVHYLSSDEVMTEMSVAVTLTWHGVKISKWKPRNGAPPAVMFQHETRLPLMWSVFWVKERGSFDVQLFSLIRSKWVEINFGQEGRQVGLAFGYFSGHQFNASKCRCKSFVQRWRIKKYIYIYVYIWA